MPKFWDYLNSISAEVRKVFDIISWCCLYCSLHELNSFFTHGKVPAQDMTPVATSRTRSIFWVLTSFSESFWSVLYNLLWCVLSYVALSKWSVCLSVFLCYILHWIISFLLRSSFLLWRSELQLDSWVRLEKEWFSKRTRDTEESAVPCNTSCRGSYLQKPGMNDVLLVRGRKPTMKMYAVPGFPLRRCDALPSWLIMRNSSSWKPARISS